MQGITLEDPHNVDRCACTHAAGGSAKCGGTCGYRRLPTMSVGVIPS